MSNNRIINIEDGPNGDPPPGPQSMEELLNSAETDWKFKRKDEAFVKALGAIALMSAGVAQSMKQSEAALAEVLKLKAALAEKEPPKE